MSDFLAFLGGAAQTGLGIIEQNRKTAEEERMLKMRDELETKRQTTLDTLRNENNLKTHQANSQFDNDLRNKPLNDYAAAVANRSKDQVPAEPPAPVTSTNGITDRSSMAGVDGNPIQSAGAGEVVDRPTSPSMKTIADMRARLLDKNLDAPGMTEEDRRGALAQLDAQAAQQNQANADAAPKTRGVTQSEAQDLAMQDLLKSGNGAAYVAGRPLQIEKTLILPDGAKMIDARTGRTLAENTGKSDRQDDREDRQDARLTKTQVYIGERQDKAISAAIEAASKRHDDATRLTPEMDANARAISTGQLPPISGYGLRSPGAAMIMARVLELNPYYSAKDYLVQSKAEKDFGTGKNGDKVRSFNVSIDHLSTLSELNDALKNGDVKQINRLGNAYADQFGGTAPGNFDAAKQIVADEIVKAITGAAGALGDRETASKTLDRAKSPEQLNGVINTYQKLMSGQLNGLRLQYQASTNKDDFDRFLSPQALKINKGSHGSSSPVVSNNSIPQGAINFLKSNPSAASDFDAKYGPGASASVLGN